MKTLLITQVFPPETGGSGRWLWEVYRRLPREQVVVAAGEHPHAAEFDAATDLRIHRMPLALPTWGFFSLQGFRGYRRLLRDVKQLAREERVEAIHTGCVLPEGWLALGMLKQLRLPYTVYVHGEELNIGAGSRELGWMMRRVFRRAGRVVVNSRNTERLMQNGWGVPAERVTVLHPGVDTGWFVPIADCGLRIADSDESGKRKAESGQIRNPKSEIRNPTILTVGRLQKRKGQDMLIRALPAIREVFPNVLYRIVGDGQQRESLEALVAELGLQDCVEFRGETTDEELAECYRQCDLFALPNREVDGDIEGFGMVLLEAQASGRPVLAGDSGGTAETMRPGETGVIVDCTSPEPLAKAVIELLSDEDRLEEMGRAAREWAVENFDWSALAEQAAELFGLKEIESSAAYHEEFATANA